MSNFKEIVARTERELMGLGHSQAERLSALISELEANYERETQALQGQLRDVNEKLATAKDARDDARAEASAAKNQLVSFNKFQKLWDNVDGQRILEAAYAHDPGGTTRALNYGGASTIAGELRDRAAAANQEAGRRLVPSFVAAPVPGPASTRCCDDHG
jgi:hypothetical protein